MSNTIKLIAAILFSILLSACGGGDGGSEESLLPAQQSTQILTSYLSQENKTKYSNYATAQTNNTWTYATSVGARVNGNGVLLAANIQSFKMAVSGFLKNFSSRVEDLSKDYYIDQNALYGELSLYQNYDANYITEVVGGSPSDASYINSIYNSAKQNLPK